MFGKAFKLFKVFGFEVKVDLSWLVIAVLVTWSLAGSLFPSYVKGLSTATYWWMGAVGALGLFASVVFHELSHSLVARRFGMEMAGITLFIFGGVSEMTDEPPKPKAEFFMAIAGPGSSIFIGGLFFIAYLIGADGALSLPVRGVLVYLGAINGLLAAFNLLPAFPLDGGRVLRAALWSWKKSLAQATRIASWVGSAFGLLMIGFGVYSIAFLGDFVGGIWIALIGMFLRNASMSSYQQVLLRKGLEGQPVRRFMQSNVVSVDPSVSVQKLVEDYIYKHTFKMYPVVDNGRLVGCVSLQQVKNIPRQEWAARSVRELASNCSPDNTIGPDADAVEALALMNKSKSSRLMVVQGGQLIGIIALKDMLKFLSLKLELGD